MKKHSYAVHLGVLAMVLTLATSCLTGGTLAKYVTEVAGTGTAVVAKWAVKAGDADGASTISNFTLKDSSASSGVADGKIAPGTSGEIPIYMDLSGTEVATELKVEIKVDDTSKLPKKFVIKDFEDKEITLQTDTFVQVYDAKKSAAEAATFKTNGSITWEWPFDDTASFKDGDDTADGQNPATAGFTVQVTATQLDSDPTPTP